MSRETPSFYPESTISKFLFASKWTAPMWAVVRIYLGFLWLRSGWEGHRLCLGRSRSGRRG